MRTGKRKTLVGKVHSDRMQKTISVDVETRYRDPRYGKYIVTTRRFLVHDAEERAGAGDRVLIAETRPLSKRKRWRLIEVIEQAAERAGGGRS